MPSIFAEGVPSQAPQTQTPASAEPSPQVAQQPPVRQSILPQEPQPAPAPPPQLREFGDHKTMRSWIYNNVMKAAQSIQPAQNSRYTLALTNPHWADPENLSLADHKRAVLRGETMHRRLRGTWNLKDNTTGEMVDQRTATIAHVPHLTNHGTFVINGVEQTLGHQMRLRPGIFTRRRENGELESHINIMPGKGLSHHYFLEPTTGIFKLKMHQANLPLITVMKAMGATDDEIHKAWGGDAAASQLLGANHQKDDPRAIDKLYHKLLGSKAQLNTTLEDKRKSVADEFNKMELDPEVTGRTLGKPFAKLTKETVLATTRKLLDVARGHADTDDRDALAYQNFLGPEDLFAERLGRDRTTLNQMLWKVTNHGHLKSIPAGALTNNVQAALLDSGLGQSLEEINPADVFDQQTRVSRLGYGGIPSIDAVPDEARSVQPSHLGYIDLLRTPESFKVGVDSRVSYASKKGSDNRIYSPFTDPKTNQQVWKSPQDVADMKIAFPGELESGRPLVAAQVGGRTRRIPRDQVDLAMPHMEQAFSPMNNLVPLKSALKGQRAAMASRFITQALPLKDAESPLVRGQVPGMPGKSFEEHYGAHMGAVMAKADGRVASVNDQGIVVKYADGTSETHELYHNFPYNRKTYLHNTPLVQPGDPVRAGQTLAKSNYTDDKGAMAIGKNLRVAYVPFKGLNYEDAYLISESAAKKLSSEHMYQHTIEWDDKHRKGRAAFASIFPSTFRKEQLTNMDDEGIIKPGTIINPGDPLILAAKERELSKKQVHSSHKGSFADETTTWDHHSSGVVTDVEKTDKGVTVAVKSLAGMQVGDKMSGRYGDKGVVSSIVPDHEMPHDEQGRPYEVLANPLGVISRTNPAQKFEAALGRIAEHTGQPQVVDDFSNIPDLNEHVIDQLAKHGLKAYTHIVDPQSGRKIPNIFTGNRFFMKLHHTSESKGQGRGLGGYTAEGMPARGGEAGSKRVALMDVNAMLSHGALNTLRDAKLIRGQKNQEYWSTFMGGNRPATPQVPQVYEKYINQLRAAGINVQRHGTQVQIMPLTDTHLNEMSGDRVLENADTVDWNKGMAPLKGGLFDERITGGHNGNRWSKIPLHEPMPNPVMEEPIRRLLGLTKESFMEVLGGQRPIGELRGPRAIQAALERIDLPQAIAQCQADIRSGRKTKRDEAIRKLGYLTMARDNKMHPKDWMLTSVPVIPPMFRPISVMQGSGTRMTGDANYLYKEVIDSNNVLKEHQGKFGEDESHDERKTLYNSFKAVTGLGDPTHPKNQDRKVKGMLAQIFGNSPKYGTVQQKLIGTSTDLVGRSVVVPNPDLNMDEVGLPENHAWEIYSPFITRRLVRSGMPRIQAMEAIKNRSEPAKKAMLQEIDDRPVVVTRAPVLHRYGLMSFWPKLVKGDTLHISPVVVGGFGMDFDGDASNYHVPASDEAREEAIERLMPSKNLLNTSRFQVHYLPRQEYVGGLHSATAQTNREKPTRTFASVKDALRAFENKELDPDQPIRVMQ